MAWFKVDDSFYDHPKVYDLADCAVALWTRAGGWSARNRTGGFVPASMAVRLCGDPETAISELVGHGLWKRTRGGYRYHDWRDYQPSKEEADAAQAKKSSGGKLGNHRRWHTERNAIDPDCQYCQPKQVSDNRSDTDRDTDRGTDRLASPPDPTRPEPLPVTDVINRPNGQLARATRIDQIIITEIAAVTGRYVTPEWAAQVRVHVLEGRHPADPVAYVQQAIRTEPNPATRFLPQY